MNGDGRGEKVYNFALVVKPEINESCSGSCSYEVRSCSSNSSNRSSTSSSSTKNINMN